MGHGAAGRRADGPAARGARRVRLRRRPARPRARARLACAPPRCWTCRWRPCWPRSTTRATRRLTFSLAGHLPPLIAPLDGRAGVRRGAPGPPLGAAVDRVRAAQRRDPAGRHGRPLHRRADRGPHAPDRRRARAAAAGADRRAAAAGGGLRPRAARARPRGGRRGRHRPAGHDHGRSAVLEAGQALAAQPQAAAAAHASPRSARAGGGASGPPAGARAGSGTGSSSGSVASPSISTRQRGELRADVPLAAAGAGDRAGERRRERDEPVGRPGDDRGRRDAVDPPARERHALAPGPTTSGRRTRRPSSSRRRPGCRRSERSPKRPVTRAESRCGAQYWPSQGTICAGPSGPNGRRGQPRGVARTARAGRGRGRPASASASARRYGRASTPRPSRVDAHGLGDRGALAARLGGERDHRPVAADAGDRADAPVGAREAPVVALEARCRGRGAGRRTGRRRRRPLSERSRRG